MKSKLMSGINQWVRLNLLFLVCMLAVRPLFFLEVRNRIGLDPQQLLTVLSGSLFDLLLVCRLATYGLIPFLLLHCFYPKIARGIYSGLIVLYAIVSALLAEYYCNLTMPLDHVILVYSVEELKETVFASSTSVSLAQVLWFVLLVGVPAVILWIGAKLREWCERFFVFHSVVLALLVVASIVVPYNRMVRDEIKLFANRDSFLLAVNQPSYSCIKIMDYMKYEENRPREDEYQFQLTTEQITAYQAAHPDFEYDYPGYPIYRKATDPDVLSPFFDKTSDGLPPNLVFIIIEGFGRHLTGVNNPGISFTPFIDSLATEGLFWPNCFSTTARTFGVLPSVFASAPHGRFGFAHFLPMPRHHSLLIDLKKNGYTTSFFYGGELTFDNYGAFMEDSQVDDLMAPQLVVDDSAHYQLLSDNNRWGFDDDQLVDFAISHKREKPDTRPHADVFLTLSTHEPFMVDSIEKYERQVKSMVERTPRLEKKERDNVLHNLNIYGVYLYTDQCIRRLVEDYASRPEFANTIFVITGDHRMAFVPSGISLRIYNVPLVVYSPLLKRTKTMNSVVSHLDIAPSFNAFLHSQYDYEINDHCHWVGTSFDTVEEFRNVRKLTFMTNNRDVPSYFSGDFFLDNGRLIILGPNLTGTIVNNEELLRQYQSELETLKAVSRFVVKRDVLMP